VVADQSVRADLEVLALAQDTLGRARDHVLGLQHADGWWQGELETNVTMDAEDLLLREFLGLHDEAQIAAAGRWIRSQQRDDGTWANFYDGPGDLSTTVEAYVALRLAGDDVDALHMKRARGWILDQGGLEATRVFTRIWLALSGQWSWDDLPVIPPELIYLPSWFPLNIYDWGCWARQTIVALAVVQSFRPSRPLPFTVDELRTGVTPGKPPADPWARVFHGLDKALHRISIPDMSAVSGAPKPQTKRERAGGCEKGRACRCGGRRCGAARTGSSPGRRKTAAGAASSRPGCTR
jgi:squalene-hopene/tetraprenyl-beta-curcumene cyclase